MDLPPISCYAVQKPVLLLFALVLLKLLLLASLLLVLLLLVLLLFIQVVFLFLKYSTTSVLSEIMISIVLTPFDCWCPLVLHVFAFFSLQGLGFIRDSMY